MTEGDQAYSRRVLNEQTRMLYEAGWLALLAALLNGFILVFVLWSVVDHQNLVIWLLLLLWITSLRLLNFGAYSKRVPRAEEADLWARRYLWGGYASSLLWGGAVILLFPADSIGHQAFLAFVVAGMCAGAVTSLSFLKGPVLAYLICTLVPLLVQFINLGSTLSFAMATMIVLFLVITVTSALRIYNNTKLNIELRFDSIDKEKALRESEERYRTIFESAPLGVLHYDDKGVVLSCNPAFTNQLGNSDEMVLGESLFVTLRNEDAQQALRDSLRGELGVFSGDISIPDRAPIYVRIFFRGIASDERHIEGGVAMVEDLTDERRVERLKNEFVSTVSHELRTPLTAIKGALGLLASEQVRLQLDTTEQLIDNANRNTERLLALINDVLDIDKIEQGKLEYRFRPVRVMAFVEKVIDNNLYYANQHEIGIVLAKRISERTIEADDQRLMQVLTNLISNAVKFSPKGAAVEILVSERQAGREVCISVQDHGDGIPPEFQDKLFDRFTQYDASDIRKVGGTGLGLSIARAIVEHHQGRLEFESEVGKGSRFDIILPGV